MTSETPTRSLRLPLLLGVLVLAAMGFAGVKVLQATGVIRSGSFEEQVLQPRPKPNHTLEEVVDLYLGSGWPLHKDVELAFMSGVFESDEGVIDYMLEFGHGGQTRLSMWDGESLDGTLTDGEHAWFFFDDEIEEAGLYEETIVTRMNMEPVFVNAEAKGVRITEAGYREGEHGYWITAQTRDGSIVEYQLAVGVSASVIFMRWTWPILDETTLVEEERYEGSLGVAPGQMLPQFIRRVSISNGERSESVWRTRQYGVVPEIEDDHFSPAGMTGEERSTRGPRW